MTRTVGQFNETLMRMGSNVVVHREDGGGACPCRTPEGFRDPGWHRRWRAASPRVTSDALGTNQFLTGYQVTYYFVAANTNLVSSPVTFSVVADNVSLYIDQFPPIMQGMTITVLRRLTPPGGVAGNPIQVNSYFISANTVIADTLSLSSSGQGVIPLTNLVTSCNEQGLLANIVETSIKGMVQPPRMRGNRSAQRIDSLLGEVQSDDRIGIFPCHWKGQLIDLSNWSDAGEDFILYDGNRYVVVSADKLADVDGDPNHHWECGLRLIKTGRPQ